MHDSSAKLRPLTVTECVLVVGMLGSFHAELSGASNEKIEVAVPDNAPTVISTSISEALPADPKNVRSDVDDDQLTVLTAAWIVLVAVKSIAPKFKPLTVAQWYVLVGRFDSNKNEAEGASNEKTSLPVPTAAEMVTIEDTSIPVPLVITVHMRVVDEIHDKLPHVLTPIDEVAVYDTVPKLKPVSVRL